MYSFNVKSFPPHFLTYLRDTTTTAAAKYLSTIYGFDTINYKIFVREKHAYTSPPQQRRERAPFPSYFTYMAVLCEFKLTTYIGLEVPRAKGAESGEEIR